MKLLVLSLACILFVGSGCAGKVHFSERAILWHDRDDLPVPSPPKRRNAQINWEGARDAIFRPADRFLGVDYLKEAVNANALDEVPDSTWFTNRRRDPSSPDDQPRWVHFAPEIVERGAVIDDGPVAPFTVVNEKSDGSSLGVVVLDSRGIKYQLKFDPPGYPGLITALEVIATRLAWAAGWNVPGETLVDFTFDDLHLAPDAWTLNRFDRRRAFTRDSLRDLIRHVEHEGKVRAVASRWIEGQSLGWFSYLGRDKRDANDRVEHQQRRDLRGFGVWAAWVDDVDTFENNTADFYVGPAGQGHVVHYQQGVGAAFGHFAAKPIQYWMGHQPYFAPGSVLGSLLTLGLIGRPWHDSSLKRDNARSLVEWPQFGYYEAERFNPRHWQPVADNPAFVRQTARDRYWGAKQVVAFNEEEVRAAIRAGKLDPVAAEHLFQVLWKRRERIARAYFSEVSPLDHFSLKGDALCFEDLWVTAGLGDDAGTRYDVEERDGKQANRLEVNQGCASLPHGAGYRIVALGAQRPGQRHRAPQVEVHLVERDGIRHIVGIKR